MVPPVPPTVPPPPSPPTSPPLAGGFNITVRVSGLTPAQQAAFQTAAARWAEVITSDLPDASYNGTPVDDVLIDASGASIDGAGGVLGQAGPDALRAGSLLPVHGVMQFDSADLARLEASGQLVSVITHEMGHVLGIGSIWQQKGLLSGAGGSDPRFVGGQATAAYDQIFGTTGAVPVENSGGAGTRDAHWREGTVGNELMTGYLNSGTNPLGRVTVASQADLGYAVNLLAADAYSPPAGGGSLVGGGSGGVAGGLSGLVAGSDWDAAGVMLDTDPVVLGAVGMRPDWSAAGPRPDAVSVADLPARPWRPAAAPPATDEAARPTPDRPTAWSHAPHARPAADGLTLLGARLG